MEDLELHMDEDVMAHIDLDGFFGDLPEAGDVIGACSSANGSSSSPDSGLSWFYEIENILMKDDEDGGVVGGGIRADSSQEFCDRFLADVLVDSPGDGSAEIAEVSGDKEVPGSPSSPGSSDDGRVEAAKVDGANGGGEAYDPASKKIKRQLRNRDAAVRSRERKKAYVKDLEVKSKYLEGECRRLGRLLQCVMAENQALHFNLQNSACGASVAKQESAVLSEPLPLGSLLWFLCITCLFTLPPPLLLALEAVLRENAGKGNLKPLAAPRGARSEMFGSCGVQTLDRSRRYKALRTKMKAGFLLPRVLA